MNLRPTYPLATFNSLGGDRIIGAVMSGIIAFFLTGFFAVYAMGEIGLAASDPVQAEVLKVYSTISREIRNGRPMAPETEYWVKLRHVQRDGQKVVFELRHGPKTHANLRHGQTVLVRFNPRNPLSSVLESEFNPNQRHKKVLWFGVVTLCAWLACGVLAFLGRATAKKLIWVRDFGHVSFAKVLRYEQSLWRGGKTTIAISAVWRDEHGNDGRSFWRQTNHFDWRNAQIITDDTGLPPIGATITVYSNPRVRRSSVWEGDVGTRPTTASNRPIQPRAQMDQAFR